MYIVYTQGIFLNEFLLLLLLLFYILVERTIEFGFGFPGKFRKLDDFLNKLRADDQYTNRIRREDMEFFINETPLHKSIEFYIYMRDVSLALATGAVQFLVMSPRADEIRQISIILGVSLLLIAIYRSNWRNGLFT